MADGRNREHEQTDKKGFCQQEGMRERWKLLKEEAGGDEEALSVTAGGEEARGRGQKKKRKKMPDSKTV